MQEYQDQNGRIWLAGQELSFSPYGGGGVLAASNLRMLEKLCQENSEIRLVTYLHSQIQVQKKEQSIVFQKEPAAACLAVILRDSVMTITFVNKELLDQIAPDQLQSLQECGAMNSDDVFALEREWQHEFWTEEKDAILSLLPDAVREDFQNLSESRQEERFLDAAISAHGVSEYDRYYANTEEVAKILGETLTKPAMQEPTL